MTDIYKFKQALTFTLKWEGGLTRDSGGLTKWGISQNAYPDLDIANLTPQEAMDIYKRDYWDRIGGDNLPMPYCVAAFDTAVNCGVGRTLGWMRATQEWRNLLDMRKTRYFTLAKNPKYRPYLKGWLARVSDLAKYCEIMDSDQSYAEGP